MGKHNIVRVIAASLVMGGLIAGGAIQHVPHAQAEGTHQFNNAQTLGATTIYADILNAGEVINISICNSANINIWNTNGTPNITGDDTQVITNAAFIANLSCGISSMPNPITGAFKYTAGSVGTYRITLSTSQQRYDFTVTANTSIDPDPTLASGRIWSYQWQISTGSFGEAAATDADMFVLVPAPTSGQHFVYKLDLNRFSGNGYTLQANSLGLDAPYSGISAAQSGSSVTPEFQIYLGYPEVAGAGSTATPTITGASFIDDAAEDNIFSPNATPGIQDEGSFTFTNNVANANYAITIDTNQNGVYGTGDRLLLGKAVVGANSVTWDGNYPNGSPVPAGVYRAQIQIRIGEYHFIAGDVETSGGTNDAGVTWNNGLTIYRMLNSTTTENTTVFWDDMTELSSGDYPTANVPLGVTSGSTADANSDGRADGFHTWGEFDGNGVGNNNNIDTYVYGPTDTEIVTIAVANSEAADADGKPASIEVSAPNNGDGNGDGTVDFLQDDVTSMPNPVNGNLYSSLEVDNCTGLSNVEIYAESQLSKTDTTYDYPMGLFNFTITCLAPGATANLKVYYDKVYDTTNWTARKYLNGTYSTITGAVFGTATVGGQQVTTLSYSVIDGGPLDADGVANGAILDPVGPGILGATSPAASGVGAPNTGYSPQNIMVAFGYVMFGFAGLIVARIYAKTALLRR